MKDLDRGFETIDLFLDRRRTAAGIPGMAVAVTDRDRLLHVFCCGYAETGSQKPVTPDTLFETASLGKSFTAALVVRLADEGLIDLDAPVAHYLPWFAVRSRFGPVRIHHLLNHTAGIIRGTEFAPHGLYDSLSLRDTETSAPPGEYWHYSSIGYKTIGFMLERVTGRSLADLLRTRVLGPLGMDATRSVIDFGTRKTTAVGYCGLLDDRPDTPDGDIVPALWSEYATADGCLVSTAGNMAVWLRMLLNRGIGPLGRLVSESGFERMAPLTPPVTEERYGYALVAYPVEGRVLLGHGGGNAGFSGQFLADIDEGFGVVVLSNRASRENEVYDAAVHILDILKAAHDHERIPEPPSRTPAIPDIADYAGSYAGTSRKLAFIAAGGKLRLAADGETVGLIPISGNRFYTPHPAFCLFPFEFLREDGRITGVWHGGDCYLKNEAPAAMKADHPYGWDAFTGHYRTRNPELSNFRVVLRGDTIACILPSGEAEPLVPLGNSLFRVGADPRSPETLRFGAVADGKAALAVYSGCPYFRTFTP